MYWYIYVASFSNSTQQTLQGTDNAAANPYRSHPAPPRFLHVEGTSRKKFREVISKLTHVYEDCSDLLGAFYFR
jgi:hypothetical protein